MHPEFAISWTFEGDSTTLYTYWTKPDLFVAWLGPDGANMHFSSFDPAGECMWRMDMADGSHKYGKIQYLLLQTPSLLVYTQHFCTAEGHFCKAPFAANYPDTLRATVRFTPLGDKCQVHFTWTIEGEATELERETFVGLQQAMAEGWSASFRKLERILHNAKEDVI